MTNNQIFQKLLSLRPQIAELLEEASNKNLLESQPDLCRLIENFDECLRQIEYYAYLEGMEQK